MLDGKGAADKPTIFVGKELVRRISISCGVVLFCIIEARELYDALVFELDCVGEVMVLAKSFSTVWLEKYGDVNPYNSKVSAQNTQMNGERTLLGQYPKPYRYLDRRYLPGTRYANHEQWSSYRTYLKVYPYEGGQIIQSHKAYGVEIRSCSMHQMSWRTSQSQGQVMGVLLA